jgi:hypothetical protein
MKFSRDMGFARISGNREIDEGLANVFRKSFSLNKSVFGKAPKGFSIIVCDTESEFRKESKYYYQRWATATVLKDRVLITRSPDFIERIGRWKRSDFQNLMNHEMNHVFWHHSYHSNRPCWLFEGLACHVGKNFTMTRKELRQIIRKHGIDSSILDYRYLRRNFRAGHIPRYPVWASFTGYIAERHSLKKLTELMDEHARNPSKASYERIFRQTFGKTERQLFREFLSSIKK